MESLSYTDLLRRKAQNGLESTSSPFLTRGLGYLETGAHELGAVPMRGDHRDEWKQIQQTTVVNWINDRLSGSKSSYSGPVVKDIQEDLKDGLLLVKLMENLTGRKLRGYAKNPSFAVQKLDNINIAFELMKAENVKLIGIGTQNVFEGNKTLIMGLVWTLIQHYQIMKHSTKVSARELMLDWVQALLPSLRITNFTSDWCSGQALLSLIHAIKPNSVPEYVTLDPKKHKSNCTLAIRTAKMHLRVPPIITPDALVSGHLDDYSMMTYLSYFVKPCCRMVIKWMKEVIPHQKITNLTTDWNSGVSFGALLNAKFPGLFPNWISFLTENGEQNIAEVQEAVRRHCGIEPTLSPKAMSSLDVDELPVMTYILRILHATLVSLPDQILVTGPGIQEAKVGKQTYFTIDTTKAGRGNLTVNAFYEDGKPLKYSLQEKKSDVVKLTYTPEIGGKVSFDILWSETPIPSSPFEVVVSKSNLIQILDAEHVQSVIHVQSRTQVRVDTSAAGYGMLTARLVYPDSLSISPDVTNDNGVYTIEFVPHQSGKPSLHMYWNKEELKHCTLNYTVLDNRQFSIAKFPAERPYHTFENIEFWVESSANLPLKPLQLTAISGDIQIPFGFKSITGSQGQAVFTPTLAGVYNIEVACVERHVERSPFSVTAVDPSKCVIEHRLPKFLALNSPHTFSINYKEAGPGKIDFKCLGGGDCSAFVSEVEMDYSRSTACLKLTPLSLGEFLLSLTHCKVEIPGCPFRVNVVDPSLCFMSGEILNTRQATVGRTVKLKLSSSDWSGLKPVVKVHGETAKYSNTATQDQDGSYNIQFTPWEVGKHEISVTLGGFNIPNSPFHFTTNSDDSGVCSATGTGLQEALTGIPAQFVVLTKQPGLIDDSQLEIMVEGVVNGVLGKVRARDNENGSYNVAYLLDQPGAYLVHIKVWGKHIAGSPFRMNALPGPDASKCRMFGPALDPLALLKIGEPIDFSVNTSGAGTGKLTVTAVGPKGVQARVFIARGDTPGCYDIKVDPVKPGKYRISVKWSGEHIPKSPFLIKVFPGVDPSKCQAYGPGLEDGEVGKSGRFTIETRDAGSGVLRVRLNGVKDAFRVQVNPVSPQDVRTLNAEYNPSKPGDYLITIKWSEKDIPGSPFKVKISGDPLVQVDSQVKLATPRQAELGTIPEELDSGDSDEKMESKSLPQVVKDKATEQKKRMSPALKKASASDSKLPVFHKRAPLFNNAFVTKPNKKVFKSLGAKGLISPGGSQSVQKMMTFSNLQVAAGKRFRSHH